MSEEEFKRIGRKERGGSRHGSYTLEKVRGSNLTPKKKKRKK